MKKPTIPQKFDLELSLAAVASTTSRIADSLEELVKSMNRLVDSTYSVDLGKVEEELGKISKSLPTNWDALDGISNGLISIQEEIKARLK